MTPTPFTVEEFGALNLADDPTEVGTTGAVDLLNVDLDRPGQLRGRDGVAQIEAITAASIQGFAGFEKSSGTRQLVVGYNNGATVNLQAFASTGGAAVATQAVVSLLSMSAARWGDPTNERLYIALLGAPAWRWDGAAFTSIAAIPQSSFLTVKTDSNRLVAGRVAGDVSVVKFSDAGAPETWTASSFVRLAPGDGSEITGLASWRELVFAFKAGRFFVFGRESTLADGSPVFDSRPVDGYGAVVPPVAGDEGVFFYDGRTVWLTTGGVPQRVGYPVERFLRGLSSVAGATVASGQPFLGYSNGRLYVTVATTGAVTQLALVYDPKLNTWTVFSWSAGTLGAMFVTTLRDPVSAVPSTYVFSGGRTLTGVNPQILRLDPSLTTDAGTAIPWSYTTGYSSAGGYFRARIVSSGERKRHFKTVIEGSGTVTHQVLALNARPNDNADPGGAVTLGTAPAIARGSRRRGVRGTYFAHKLSGTAPAVINGFTYWLANIESDT